MPNEEIIKTSVRLPVGLHAEIERAAATGGLSVNGEMVFRLTHDPRVASAGVVLDEMRKMQANIVDALTRQNAALWATLDRADSVLGDVESAMSQVKQGTDAAALRREVEFARELIKTLESSRPRGVAV